MGDFGGGSAKTGNGEKKEDAAGEGEKEEFEGPRMRIREEKRLTEKFEGVAHAHKSVFLNCFSTNYDAKFENFSLRTVSPSHILAPSVFCCSIESITFAQ